MSSSHSRSLACTLSRSVHKVRSLAGLSALTLGLFAGGCGNTSPATDHARGGAFTARGFDEATIGDDGTPRFLSGHMPAAITDGASAARLLLTEFAASYRLAPETSFVVRTQQHESDGRNYYRLVQRHAGLRVVGREVAIQIGSDGAVESIHGQLAPDLKVEVAPTLAGDAALSGALSTLSRGSFRLHSRPELAIYVDRAGASRLGYGAMVEYVGTEGHTIEELWVSAVDGSVLAHHPRQYRAGLSRTGYTLMGGCIHDGSELPGTKTIDEGGTTTEPATQRAYDNAGNTYYYYQHMFNRHSYDDADAQLVSTVHVTFDTGMGSCDGGNAAWIPDPFNEMVYGDGSFAGIILKEMTLGYDVAAHEMSHAVTFATSGLEYMDESGALNEANSDIMGATAEAWVSSGGGKAGSPASITTTDKTWKIGEDVAGILIPGGALRFMNDPTKDMVSKDNYAERLMPGSEDNGGVHLNSGIANLFYYLLVTGGSHPRMKTPGVVVRGIGINKAAHIFEFANTRLFTAMTDFEGARYGTARAAETLYGRCGEEWAQVHRAWDAVGVPGTWSPCVQPPSSF